MINLLVRPVDLELEEMTVEGDAYRHLFRARRLGPGDRVRLVDGRGRARWSEVMRVGRIRAVLRLQEAAAGGEPDIHLTLAVGALRPERASWLVEKVTEIGVSGILWYRSERSGRTFGSGTLQRFERVANAAVEQSGRSRAPEIRGMLEWTELLESVEREPSILLDPTAEAGQAGRPAGTRLLVLIGPEGGFAPGERLELVARGAQSWDLGERILRVETAAVAASALLLLPPFA